MSDPDVISSEEVTPSRARGCAESRAGMTLLSVAFALLARASLRDAAGGRPREGLVRPMFLFLSFFLSLF